VRTLLDLIGVIMIVLGCIFAAAGCLLLGYPGGAGGGFSFILGIFLIAIG
jgi:hypothetical protein